MWQQCFGKIVCCYFLAISCRQHFYTATIMLCKIMFVVADEASLYLLGDKDFHISLWLNKLLRSSTWSSLHAFIRVLFYFSICIPGKCQFNKFRENRLLLKHKLIYSLMRCETMIYVQFEFDFMTVFYHTKPIFIFITTTTSFCIACNQMESWRL